RWIAMQGKIDFPRARIIVKVKLSIVIPAREAQAPQYWKKWTPANKTVTTKTEGTAPTLRLRPEYKTPRYTISSISGAVSTAINARATRTCIEVFSISSKEVSLDGGRNLSRMILIACIEITTPTVNITLYNPDRSGQLQPSVAQKGRFPIRVTIAQQNA